MNFLLILLLLILGIGFVGLIVWLVLLLTRKEDDLKDENIILNWMPQFSSPKKGYFLGVELETTKVDGRQLITYIPKDINSRENKDNDKEIEPVSIVSDKEHTISLSMGDLSNGRNVKIILPLNPEDFPTGMKETRFGQAMMKFVEDINAENTVTEVQRKRITVEDKLLHKTEGKDRVGEYIQLDEGLNRSMAKKVLEKEKLSETKTTPYNRPEYK